MTSNSLIVSKTASDQSEWMPALNNQHSYAEGTSPPPESVVAVDLF